MRDFFANDCVVAYGACFVVVCLVFELLSAAA